MKTPADHTITGSINFHVIIVVLTTGNREEDVHATQ